MMLSDAIRTSYRLGVCCPGDMALPTIARCQGDSAKAQAARIAAHREVGQSGANLRLDSRKIGQSNRSQRWSASRTRLAMAFSNCTLTGTRCVAIRVLRKLSPRSHRKRRKTDYACLFSPACDAARNWNARKLMNAATQSHANQSSVRA